MFSSVPMTQINVASPVSKLDDVLSVMEKLGCIHIQPYTQFEDIRRWYKERESKCKSQKSFYLAIILIQLQFSADHSFCWK